MNVREWALPVYTILMQLGAGSLLVMWLMRTANRRIPAAEMDRVLHRPVMVVFFTLLVAVIGAHFHLSNPLLSFLAIFNLDDSWLSREIVFTVLTLMCCAALVDQLNKQDGQRQRLKTVLGWATIGFGFSANYCMASIYRLPTQPPWNHWTTILLFYGSSILLGIVSATALLVMDAIFSQANPSEPAGAGEFMLREAYSRLMWVMLGVALVVIGLNFAQVWATSRGHSLAQLNVSLLRDLYQPLILLRFVALLVGSAIVVAIAIQLRKRQKQLAQMVTPVYMACLMVLVSEILGRFLFYATHVRLGV